MLIKNRKIYLSGSTLVLSIVFIAIFLTLSISALNWVLLQNKKSFRDQIKEKVFAIAEAGIDYYHWHLAHDPQDYQDGTGEPGPYIHDYYDINGNLIGKFELEIIPPQIGSTIVTVKSTGYLISQPQIKRTIATKQGIPSLTTYAVIANDNMRFGPDTETYGKVHSNGGIRFDGVAHNIVSSYKETYTDPDSGLTKPGVWTALPNENEVFLAGKKYPAPLVDFNKITKDLNDIKSDAQANGIYLPPSGNRGYYIHLRDDQKLDIYKVTGVSSQCDGKDTDRINNKKTFTYQGESSIGIAMPVNGLIFVEDKLWIDGKINNNRLTIAVGFSTSNDIIINNDLTYTNYDGSDSLGLIAQNNISVGLYSENDLEINGALFAQTGRVGRNYFPSNCSSTYYKRNSLTLRGALGTNKRYGFRWVCGGSYCSGYEYRYLTFDENLIFMPPPSFPTAPTSTYSIISWIEE
ncbi:MAG: Uncharacterized protein Athens101410_47 [Parcubacteria group bacterium Athens1014_10]|nr:MAG: Uncharacterized protein Athens101410_47 [Parcubacteria group bacterium Athens1014_10]TSD06073.1 MAG: Uncharacterized protein Athens071412_47 [Parcubacteria group bacterium Athens0714_12]